MRLLRWRIWYFQCLRLSGRVALKLGYLTCKIAKLNNPWLTIMALELIGSRCLRCSSWLRKKARKVLEEVAEASS